MDGMNVAADHHSTPPMGQTLSIRHPIEASPQRDKAGGISSVPCLRLGEGQ